jgi:hypothetical protein
MHKTDEKEPIFSVENIVLKVAAQVKPIIVDGCSNTDDANRVFLAISSLYLRMFFDNIHTNPDKIEEAESFILKSIWELSRTWKSNGGHSVNLETKEEKLVGV